MHLSAGKTIPPAASSGDHFARQVVRRYVVGWAIVVTGLLLLCLLYFLTVRLEVSQANIVNLSGRQRMLSQRIPYLLLRAETKPLGSKARTDALAMALDNMDLFEESYHALREAAVADQPGARTGGSISARYEELEAAIVAFCEEGRRLATELVEAPVSDEEMIAYNQRSDALLPELDGLVKLHEQQEDQSHGWQVTFFFIAILASLTALVLEAWIVFRPVARRFRDEFQQLRIFRQVVEDAQEALLVTDAMQPDNPIVYGNPRFEEMMGYPPEEYLGKNCRFLQGKDTDPDTVAILHEAVLQQVPVSVEVLNYRKDGSEIWKEISISPVRDDNGRVICHVGIQTDITARRRIDARLQANEALLRQFVENTPAAVAMFDTEMRYLVASRNWIHDYNLEEQELIGRSHYDVFPEIGEDWKQIHRECLAGAINTCDEAAFPRQDGTCDWLRWDVRPWHKEFGEIGGIIIFTEVITERKRAEEELHTSRERLAMALEGGNEGLWDWNIATGDVYFSPRWFLMLGYEPDELPARIDTWQAVAHPDDVAPAEAALKAHWRGEAERYECERRFRRKDGTWAWILDRGKVVERDEQGEPARMVGTHIDVTARRMAEDLIRQRDQLLQGEADAARALLSHKPFSERVNEALAALGTATEVDRVYVFQSHKHPEDGRAVLSQRFEWARDSVSAEINNPDLTNLDWETLSRWRKILSGRGVVQGRVQDFPAEERAILEPQGIVSILVAPILVGDELWGFVGFDNCHTEHLWTDNETAILNVAANNLGFACVREAIEEQLQRLAAIVENSHDAIDAKTLDGKIVSWNRAAEELYGFPRDEAVGRSIHIVVPEDRREELAGILQRIRKGERVERVETVRRRKDGTLIDVSLTLSPIRNAMGEIVGASAIGHDISERKRFIQMLDDKNAQLEEYANQMETLAAERAKALVHADRLASIGTLSAGVAHEVNNPVSFIAGNLDTMVELWPALRVALRKSRELEGVDTGEVDFALAEMPEILSSISDGVTRITRIVDGLKTFAREDKGTKDPCRVNDCIEAALVLCHNRLKYHMTVEKSLAADLPTILGNAQQLEQVLVNLFVNAADATSGQGQSVLSIASTHGGGGVRIRVSNSGPPIPADVMERLWEPFFTTKPVGEGTGLGLAISRGIVEDHDGTIYAENLPEGGVRFTIELPVPEVSAAT